MDFLWGILLFMIIIVVFLLGYWKLRPRFPIKVNCWFCNQDTQVPYGNRNCWDCPHCEQYNGFDSDGGYNKPVPAQFTEDINHPISCEPAEFLTRKQFLCPTCQRNQLLKTKQLAAFEPLNETTYEEEISFYKRHLEKVYALCPACNTVVNRELERLDESLNQQLDVSKDALSPSGSSAETETSRSIYKILPALKWLPRVVSLTPTVCTMLLGGLAMDSYRPGTKQGWVVGEVGDHVDRLGVGLSGLVLCVFSKLLHGMHKLHVWDALHIVLWLVVVLTGLLLPHPLLNVGLPALLLALELPLAFRHRHLSNVVLPVMKRLSLEGGASAANSDAASDAVSSVSTSCRQRCQSSFQDGGDGPGVSVLKALSGVKTPASRGAQGLSGTCEAAKEDIVLDELGRGLGSVLLSVPSSESGYSSGKSTLFSSNTFGAVRRMSVGSNVFGPVRQTSFSPGVPFPRPLITPAKLSALSFSQTGPGRSTVTNSLWSQPSSLFGGVEAHGTVSSSCHANPFLLQGSRPLSIFSSRMADRTLTSIPESVPQYQTPCSSSTLFSTMTNRSIRTQTKASSEINFPLSRVKPSHSKSVTAWWRSSASDIMDSRDDGPRHFDGKGIVSSTADSWEDRPQNTMASVESRETPVSESTPAECDSTTPLLSQLKISMAPKKKKKKTSKQHVKELADSCVFSDDEEEGQFIHPTPSTVSTVVLQSKQDWSWLQWMVIGVMAVSVSTNLFLTWAVWTSRP